MPLLAVPGTRRQQAGRKGRAPALNDNVFLEFKGHMNIFFFLLFVFLKINI